MSTTTSTTDIDHGFRSPTSVVAYCGAVERPTEPRKPMLPGMNACPECITEYAKLANREVEEIMALLRPSWAEVS